MKLLEIIIIIVLVSILLSTFWFLARRGSACPCEMVYISLGRIRVLIGEAQDMCIYTYQSVRTGLASGFY